MYDRLLCRLIHWWSGLKRRLVMEKKKLRIPKPILKIVSQRSNFYTLFSYMVLLPSLNLYQSFLNYCILILSQVSQLACSIALPRLHMRMSYSTTPTSLHAEMHKQVDQTWCTVAWGYHNNNNNPNHFRGSGQVRPGQITSGLDR